MELNKITNYKFNERELINKIKDLKNKNNKTERDKNLIRKYKSEIDEYPILKYINDNERVEAIKYIGDLTGQDIVTFEDFEQNTLNCIGADLLVKNIDNKFFRVDVKVLEYYPIHYKTRKIYNGNLKDDIWGMENFIFQVEGKMETLGWANNRYKQTDILMIYIKATKKIYSFNYKNLVAWINDKINRKEITEKDYIIFKKGYGITGTRECIVSLPCNDIPEGVITSIYDVN